MTFELVTRLPLRTALGEVLEYSIAPLEFFSSDQVQGFQSTLKEDGLLRESSYKLSFYCLHLKGKTIQNIQVHNFFE